MITIAGLVPFTTIDFPNRLAAVIFFQGCPLRCPFCHNPDLQPHIQTQSQMEWTDVCSFMEKRKKRLDGIVLSGGEPLMQQDIILIIQTLKEMGFQIAIHTSGVYPKRLADILPLIDWVGLDIKAPWNKYDILTGQRNFALNVQESLHLLLQSGIDYEVRTTCDPRFLTIEDIYQLGNMLAQTGVTTYTLQKYRTFDSDKNPPSTQAIDSFFDDEKLIQTLQTQFNRFTCR